MSGKEVREYTNLSDPKDRKWGKGKDKIDDEDITFQRMVAKMQEVAGERGGYLHGRGGTCFYWFLAVCFPMISLSLLYLQLWTAMTCYTLRNRWKLRKMLNGFFDGLKNGHLLHLKAASLVDSSPAPLPLPLRVEPKAKSGIRQQDILKKIIQVMPKKQKVSSHSLLQSEHSNQSSSGRGSIPVDSEGKLEKSLSPSRPSEVHKISCSVVTNSPQREQEQEVDARPETTVKSLLGLAYESSDEE
ncbi:uncharacterized protein LOC121974824 isoform X1 [Zingiber officinale]|uniref:uncharacterized protein LOC121974824 isoform X1 n=2 Tax=Zingiber officinale TaxID=94328 RepID=UPI001C4AD7C2|nr:uncharacterized protein LOC121974824 isoform X1 [Zingiber officinale]